MKSEHRLQVILAAISNPEFLKRQQGESRRAPGEVACEIMNFVDAIEKFDNVHELEYEQTIVENTHEILGECIAAGRDRLREVLPTVMTFKAMAATGATSSLIVNLQAQFTETLKKLSGGPASVTEADAKLFHELFGLFVEKYKTAIEEMKAELGPHFTPR